MAGWMETPLGMKVCLGLGDFVLDGDPAPLPKRGTALQFSAHIYCDRTAAIFGLFLLWPNGRMDQDAT